MFKEALILGFLLAYAPLGHSQNFPDPFAQTWNWHSAPRHNLFPDAGLPNPAPERDREELDANYKDPIASGTEDKPILKPTKKPSYNAGVIPGGVVDVDAVGAPFIPETGFGDGGEFDFSSWGGAGNAQFPGGAGGVFGLGGFFGAGEFKPWWKGANVCIEREESTDDDDNDEDDEEKNKNNETSEAIPNFFSTAISLSNCQQSSNKYECVTKINNHGVFKTFTVRYKCCYGYVRSSESSSGCDKQLDLKGLLETIDELGAKEFRNLIQSNGQDDLFQANNYTIFVPTDQAINDFNEKMFELNNVNEHGRDVKNPLSNKELVLSHVVAGFVDLADLSNEELIFSENSNSSIRINYYPTVSGEKLTTVNCARIKKANNLATNGVAHLIERVAQPATQTLQEIISNHPKLGNLRQVFENSDSFKNLRAEGHYTIFAPTDDAFNKLEASARQKLIQGGDACGISILKHHITSHTICSAAINGNATTHNIEGEVLNMERTGDDELKLEEKAKIVESDIMGSNGVIHLIDAILIPDSALHINDALKNENLTKFSELVAKAGLEDELDALINSTVFVPSNEAFSEPKVAKYLDGIGDDKDKLKELIRYHTVSGQLPSSEMNNNALLKTNSADRELRLNLYSTVPLFTNVINRATINCARVVGFDQKSCGSMIHEVSKVLIPPTSNILDVIRGDAKYSTLVEIMKDTEVEKILQESNKSITFLAPTDETFAAIEEAELKSLRNDKEKANSVLLNHILDEVLCCSGVGPQTFGFNSVVPTLGHQHLQVGRTAGHQIRIGRAVVTSCDNLATNGVVHTINKVLFPQRRNPGHNFGGFFLLDL